MSKKVPERQCVGCREMKGKNELLRLVKTKEGEVVLDGSGKMNGRGAYLCPNGECLKKAIKARGLERSLKAAVPKDVIGELEKEMGKVAAG